MSKVNVFVSSTCYDLLQVRADMKDFIERLGHRPFLSNLHSFPIDPSKNTYDNVIDAVNKFADIFILIIGNRYGSILNHDKSITNMEFETAKEKGIPIYVFIQKQMVSVLPIWENNKEGNYNIVVDNTKIFDFILAIRTNSKLWCYEYENVQEIYLIIESQLSYLFKRLLDLKRIEKL